MGFKIAKNSVIEREYEVNGSPSIPRQAWNWWSTAFLKDYHYSLYFNMSILNWLTNIVNRYHCYKGLAGKAKSKVILKAE